MANQSENIIDITCAIINLQSELGFASKDRANPFFKSKYADLASVWETCCELLTKNNLAVIQTLDVVDANYENKTHDREGKIKTDQKGNKQNVLMTTLAHSSGQWFRSTSLICPISHDPQGIGSAITYMRRYSLCAILGVIQDDDDGEKAMDRKKIHKNEPSKLEIINSTSQKEHMKKLFSNFSKFFDFYDESLIIDYLSKCAEKAKLTAEQVLEAYKDDKKFLVDFNNWKAKQIQS